MKNSEKQKNPIQNLYCLYDSAARRYFPPFLSDNNDTAQRYLKSSLTSTDSVIAQHPDDYSLYMVGDFDPDSGQIDVVDQPILVCHASQINSKLQTV